MTSPHMPYDPIVWGQRLTAARTVADFAALFRDAEQGYALDRAADWAGRTPETHSRCRHWGALLRAITMQRDLRFPPPTPTYTLTDYATPGELRHRVGTF